MKKYVFVIMLIMLSSIIYAQDEIDHHDFSEAIEIIENEIPCDELTDEQFEIIGDYYMEQMHPGEAHEIMDERMGGEGSDSLRIMHINMGKNFYCNDNTGMMGGMMGGGMMYNSGRHVINNFSWFNFMQGVIVTLLLTVLIITVIILIKGNKK